MSFSAQKQAKCPRAIADRGLAGDGHLGRIDAHEDVVEPAGDIDVRSRRVGGDPLGMIADGIVCTTFRLPMSMTLTVLAYWLVTKACCPGERHGVGAVADRHGADRPCPLRCR